MPDFLATCAAPDRDRPALRRARVGARHQRQFQRGPRSRSASPGDHVQRHVEGRSRRPTRSSKSMPTAPTGTGTGRPSAEARLHVEIVRARGAGAVLHTHSMWSTLLSDRHAARAGFAIEGYEMLKGLEGVRDPRAPGVDSRPRERPGHAAAGRRGSGSPRSAIRRATPSFSGATGCTLGATRCRRPCATSKLSSSCSKRSPEPSGLRSAGVEAALGGAQPEPS